ncbi:hypothetical protein L7D48_11535 [Streptomyces sp. S1A]|uniref:hypothetical protein n=1 Tax=Streptomyces sp. ICN903 TaxID=2964654 RepID=UPI001EDAEBAC|nr:hypothetical protein [Streptomyces sp. ICN903]MCG3041184.1 hypothetical protein [Streptomyces sp. ICN903]
MAGYLVFLAYMSGTANPWEPDAAAHSGFTAGPALLVTGVCALPARGFVRAGHLCRRWYALPAFLGLAALLRPTVLAPYGRHRHERRRTSCPGHGPRPHPSEAGRVL